MKKTAKTLAALLLIFAFVTLLFGCGCDNDDDNKRKIKDRINTFADAYSSGDSQRMIDCFDSDTKSTMSAAAGMGNDVLNGINSLTGMDISVKDILNIALNVSGLLKGDNLTVKSVDDIKISGDSATAVVTMAFEDDGESDAESKKLTVEFVKESDDWYIKSFNK